MYFLCSCNLSTIFKLFVLFHFLCHYLLGYSYFFCTYFGDFFRCYKLFRFLAHILQWLGTYSKKIVLLCEFTIDISSGSKRFLKLFSVPRKSLRIKKYRVFRLDAHHIAFRKAVASAVQNEQ